MPPTRAEIMETEMTEKKLMEMTGAELVDLHNTLGAEQIAAPWKRPKAELVAKIEALRAHSAPKPQRSKPEAPKAAQGTNMETVDVPLGAFVASMLADGSKSYGDILAAVREAYPEARTTARSLASTASTLRRKGAEIPSRRAEGREAAQ